MSEFDASTPPPPPSEKPTSGPDEKTWTIIMRLTPLAQLVGIPLAGIVTSLIIWVLKKDEFPAVDAHGKEVINFQITIAIVITALVIFFFIPILGWLLAPLLIFVVSIFALVMIIIGAIDASNGKFRTYPFTLRLLK